MALTLLSLLVLALLTHGCVSTPTSGSAGTTGSGAPTTVAATTPASASSTTATTAASTATAPATSASTTATSASGPPSDGAVKAAVTKVGPSVVTADAGDARGGRAEGPGVVYTADGLILTRNAVVAPNGKPAKSLSVRFASGETIAATLVGQDATHELAVIKVQKVNLSPIVFGGAQKVGDWVILVPYGAAASAVATTVVGLAGQLPTTPPLTGLLLVAGVGGPGYGPVVDAQGNLVGLLEGYMPATKTGLAIPAGLLLATAKRLAGR